MKQFRRKIMDEEVSNIKPPGYEISIGRHLTEADKQRMVLLNREIKRHPGYSVRMHCKNGIPVSFTYFKRSPEEIVLRKRIARTLSGVRKDVAGNRSKEKIFFKIDRAIERVKETLWEE